MLRAAGSVALVSALLFAATACRGEKEAAPATTVLRVTNETQCILHVRFDNGYPIGRVQPGATMEFSDAKLETYRYVKAESTQAIFRTYNMEQVRQDGYTLTIKPAIDDHPCVEKP